MKIVLIVFAVLVGGAALLVLAVIWNSRRSFREYDRRNKK